jgi:hypothetical protein
LAKYRVVEVRDDQLGVGVERTDARNFLNHVNQTVQDSE